MEYSEAPTINGEADVDTMEYTTSSTRNGYTEVDGKPLWKCSDPLCNHPNMFYLDKCDICQRKKDTETMEYSEAPTINGEADVDTMEYTTSSTRNGYTEVDGKPLWKCSDPLCNHPNMFYLDKCDICQRKKESDEHPYDIVSVEEDKTDKRVTNLPLVHTVNFATNDDTGDTTATLFLCFLFIFCLAIFGGVQLAVFKQQRATYQSLEDAALIEENVNPQTVIEVHEEEEEEEHRLPPDSRDYATEVCRSVCLASVCCAAWIIVPYYHW
eukprot:395013_1